MLLLSFKQAFFKKNLDGIKCFFGTFHFTVFIKRTQVEGFSNGLRSSRNPYSRKTPSEAITIG